MSGKKSNSPSARNVALCYIRKSWSRDEKDSISPERQRAHIQAVCDAHNWQPEWYEDIDGHRSGMHEKNRPNWLALKARLRDKDVVALVANDLARLHRKGWRVGDLLEFVDQHGITLVLADPRRQIDFSTPHGRLMAQLSAIFDEWYATDISERWKASINHRKSKGITVGLPPFGTQRDKRTGYLQPSNEGAWLLPDGTWVAGKKDDQKPGEETIWRGYYECAERILRLYAEKWAGRDKITRKLQEEGWAYRDRNGNPAPLEVDDIRRVTNNWPEYGGIVIGNRARERHPHDYDLEAIQLNPERAVFDINMLLKVGHVQKERSHRAYDRGHSRTDHPYPLSAITYCAPCEHAAREQDNPKLRSRLGGKSQKIYRHKPGASCGCKRKSISRETYEGDFLRLIRLLEIKPEMQPLLTQLAVQVNSVNAQDEEQLAAKKAAAIARCQRRIEAARNLYKDGDPSTTYEDYLRIKEQNEREVVYWRTVTTETEKLSLQLAVCVEAIDRIARLWETSSDEDKQGMARNLFEYIVVDLDKQQIVDYQFKGWADQLLTLRSALYPDPENDGHAASGGESGTNSAPSPVRVNKRFIT